MIPTGLVVGSASLLAQPAQSLQQSGVFGLQLFDQPLGGALVHHRPVLDTLCPEEEEEEAGGCGGVNGEQSDL